ncbi:MAG: hydrogenase nickel incorporation protein HypB [Synechococcaceae cyanobacterium]
MPSALKLEELQESPEAPAPDAPAPHRHAPHRHGPAQGQPLEEPRTLVSQQPLAPQQPQAQQQPLGQGRWLGLEQRLLRHNDQLAAANRLRFQAAGLRAVNLLSSPGSGKTALLECLAQHQAPQGSMAALVGDLATDLDSQRLRRAGLPAVQLTTGQGCHLDAAMVARGLDRLQAAGTALRELRWLWIENVGTLVCPAAYDLGEDLRMVLLAVGEGEDKPLKYPAMFRSADVVLITKVDLAEAVGFDRAAARANIARVAPGAAVLEISARTGVGLEALWELCGGPLPQPVG